MSTKITLFGWAGDHKTVRSEYDDGAMVEVDLPDGRKVRLSVRADGDVTVQAWPGVPLLAGNADAARVTFNLPTTEQMVLDGAVVTGLSVRTHPVTERHLITPDRPHDGWAYANDSVRAEAARIAALAAARRAGGAA